MKNDTVVMEHEKNKKNDAESERLALRKKCPYSELFWSAFSRIQSECRKMGTRITPNTYIFYAT